MSGASGKVPAAIHLSPEAAVGGPIAKLRDGDVIELNAKTGELSVETQDDFSARAPVALDLSANAHGMGRELFSVFRKNADAASMGASVF